MDSAIVKKQTKAVESIIQTHIEKRPNTIFVFTGISPYVDIDAFLANIADVETFDVDGNSDVYSKTWFATIFPKLATATTYQIISHQQFAYLADYLSEEYFKDRVLIIYDNLRNLFPISADNYREQVGESYSENRPDDLPIYHAEQFKIDNNYFYAYQLPSDTFAREPLFHLSKDLTSRDAAEGGEVLDVVSDHYAIDGFVNSCIANGSFARDVYVKISTKNVLNKAVVKTLQMLNHLVMQSGGGVYALPEEPICRDYVPQEETLSLLRKYWGENAKFNDILVYENPEVSNNVIPVSQGLIVETIISEYKRGLEGSDPRDVFITAPTGAGKSLIFQLPAFYAASKGDFTIVVSPLKALMTDQVEILHKQRNYQKVGFINSDLTLIEREKILAGCHRGDIDILYLSPELLLSYDIHHFLGERKLGLLIVDEAHLITTWGRDFRVDYWFLGNHVHKIRKFNNYKFPLVALTATAVYGGVNDMVHDSIHSLNMHHPHKFIGNVRRDNIEFVINTHDGYSSGKYDDNKEKETVDIIRGLHGLGLKTIVYAPYSRHIDRLKRAVDEIDPQIAVTYHGKMNADIQQFSYHTYKKNNSRVMIATKAFGMGVDIPDIQVVYHHAPSGLLPDYVQEIGRAARNKNIQGYAAITFSKSDLRYSKQLFGISSLKTFQLQEIMRRIICYYNTNGKKRNMLMSASDFAYIFEGADDIDQKVATALMMIEKDYLNKVRFNVVIARPKAIFTRVYARVNDASISRLSRFFGGDYHVISSPKSNQHIIELNLEGIWSKHFSDTSFPQIKSKFYKGTFLEEHDIELIPQVKVTININQSYTFVLNELQGVLNAIETVFAQFNLKGEFFSQREFTERLNDILPGKYKADKIAAFILGTYSQRSDGKEEVEGDSFLQQRRQGAGVEYLAFNTNYSAKTSQLMRIFSNIFDGNETQSVNRYLTVKKLPLKNHIRLGSLLELMDMGTYETTGGDDPKFFLRINDPYRIAKDSKSATYTNQILESVKNRHATSCLLFEHFFTSYFTSARRWDFIEDFFLGMSNDDIFEKYPSDMVSHVDIIDYLGKNAQIVGRTDVADGTANDCDLFPPQEGRYYSSDSLLSIGRRTLSITKWIVEDAVALHRTVMEYKLVLHAEDFRIMASKLQNHHFAYYRDYMKLDLKIEFPGYEGRVAASIPYQDQPVKFYQWWRKNQDKVTMNTVQTIKLFLKVDEISPKTLIKAHKAKIGK